MTRNPRPLSIVSLRGTEAEMGAQFGEMSAADGSLQDLIAYYKDMPRNLVRPSSRASWTDGLMVSALSPIFEAQLKKLDGKRIPAFRARSVAGLAAGGLGDHHARYLNVMDLFQNTIGLLARYGLVPFSQRVASNMPPMCTSAVVWGDSSAEGMLHARNFDFPGVGVWDARPTVVFCTPDDGLRYGYITSFGADVPGVTCFNEAGITLDAHTRFHRDVSMSGTPVIDLGHAVIKHASTLDEAVAILRENPSASSYGFTISSATEGRAIVVEVTSRAVEVVECQPGESFLVTTNRYHSPSLQVDEVSPGPAWLHNCDGRMRAARRAVQEGIGRGGVSAVDLQRMLGDHRDPDTGEERPAVAVISQANTVQSVVIDATRRVVHVSVGEVPTGIGPYIEVPFCWDEPIGVREVRASDEAVHLPSFMVGDGGRAHQHYIEASRLCDTAAPTEQILAELDAALALAPTDPTYHFLAASIRLGSGEVQASITHFDIALAYENNPFQRGQVLLWASRAHSAARKTDRAEALRDELLRHHGPHLAAYRQAASKERGTFTRAKKKAVHVQMVDVF